jgi:hypothetical protein
MVFNLARRWLDPTGCSARADEGRRVVSGSLDGVEHRTVNTHSIVLSPFQDCLRDLRPHRSGQWLQPHTAPPLNALTLNFFTTL